MSFELEPVEIWIPKYSFRESVLDSEYARLLKQYQNCCGESKDFESLNFSSEERSIFRQYFIAYACFKLPANDRTEFLGRHPVNQVISTIPVLNLITRVYEYQHGLLQELHDGMEAAAADAAIFMGLTKNNWLKIAASRISSAYFENHNKDKEERQEKLLSEIRSIKRPSTN